MAEAEPAEGELPPEEVTGVTELESIEDEVGDKRPNPCRLCLLFCKVYWKSIMVVLTPIVFLPLIFATPPEKKKEFLCLYVICVLATYWVSEALNTAITALLPILLFPLFGILDTETACMLYFKETTIMFIGSLVVANAIQYSGLHVRFALKCLLIVGSSHRKLSLGLFLVTMFVSMWITNTAATAMFTPIIFAVIETLEQEGMCVVYKSLADPNVPGSTNVPSRTTLAYFLGVAYAATIGGCGTYVGTGTNLAAREQLEKYYPNSIPQFHEWMMIACPIMILNISCLWLWINVMFLGLWWKGGCDPQVRENLMESKEKRKEVEQTIRKVILDKYHSLGKLTWHETMTGLVFLLCVCLWFFRSPRFISGWADVLVDHFYIKTDESLSVNDTIKDKSKYKSKDSGAAIFTIFLFFAIPTTLHFIRFCKSKASGYPKEEGPGLMSWLTIHEKTSWGLLYVIGCGFTIAEASNKSKMSDMIGEFLKQLGSLPDFGIMFLSSMMGSLITEFTSNVAVLNIIGPVILTMGKKLNLNGPYLFVPVALSCSYAFMLPVGTPPNAVVAGMASISTKDMIIAGTGPKLVGQIFTTIVCHFLVQAVMWQ